MSWPREEFESFGTDAIHAGQEPEKWECRAVVPLIGLSTTFKQESPGKNRWYKTFLYFFKANFDMDATSTLEVATQLGNALKSVWQNSKMENTAWRTHLDLVRLCLSLKLFSKFESKFESVLTFFRTATMLLLEMICTEVPIATWISALPSTESSSPWSTHEILKTSVMHYARTPSLFGSKPQLIPYSV